MHREFVHACTSLRAPSRIIVRSMVKIRFGSQLFTGEIQSLGRVANNFGYGGQINPTTYHTCNASRLSHDC